jgi:hypothetical protein
VQSVRNQTALPPEKIQLCLGKILGAAAQILHKPECQPGDREGHLVALDGRHCWKDREVLKASIQTCLVLLCGNSPKFQRNLLSLLLDGP